MVTCTVAAALLAAGALLVSSRGPEVGPAAAGSPAVAPAETAASPSTTPASAPASPSPLPASEETAAASPAEAPAEPAEESVADAPADETTEAQDAEIPDVRGRKRAEAARVLVAAGFSTRVQVDPRDQAAPGTVVEQNPLPGRAPRGSRVQITVSGPGFISR